jgi:hypothetical protein
VAGFSPSATVSPANHSFHLSLSIHNHLSVRAGIIGQLIVSLIVGSFLLQAHR